MVRDAGVGLATTEFCGKFYFATRRILKREIRLFQPDVVLTWMNRATNFGRGRVIAAVSAMLEHRAEC